MVSRGPGAAGAGSLSSTNRTGDPHRGVHDPRQAQGRLGPLVPHHAVRGVHLAVSVAVSALLFRRRTA